MRAGYRVEEEEEGTIWKSSEGKWRREGAVKKRVWAIQEAIIRETNKNRAYQTSSMYWTKTNPTYLAITIFSLSTKIQKNQNLPQPHTLRLFFFSLFFSLSNLLPSFSFLLYLPAYLPTPSPPLRLSCPPFFFLSSFFFFCIIISTQFFTLFSFLRYHFTRFFLCSFFLDSRSKLFILMDFSSLFSSNWGGGVM